MGIRKGYKLFRLKDGRLYPLYILYNKPIPLGQWLDAEVGPLAPDGVHVKGKMTLAMRPGWHIAGSRPEAPQITIKDNLVWAEVEYHDDVDYDTEAKANGYKNGHWAAVRAYIKHIPKNGFYMYKTSWKQTEPWVIAGEMRVVRVLSDEEVERLNSH